MQTRLRAFSIYHLAISICWLGTLASGQNVSTPIKNPVLSGTADFSGVSNPSTVRSQIGLGNVDNTSDATRNAAAATLTNKTISGASNTISNLPASAIASGTLNDARLSSNVMLATGVGTTYFPTKLVSGALNTWSADFAGQFLASTDGISWSLARAAGAGHAVDEAVCQNSNMVFHGVRLETLDISAGTGEMLLNRNANGQNVLAIQNSLGTQGSVSAIAFRDSNGQEKGAFGSGPRGTGTVLYPFTDSVYLESSQVIGNGVPYTGPNLAKDIVLEMAHLNGSQAIEFNERIRITDGGNITIWQNGIWPGQSAALTIGNTNITLGLPLVTGTINGITITPGSGTLTLAAGKTLTASNSLTLSGTDGSTLNVGTGGTLNAGAFSQAANPTGSVGTTAVNGTAPTYLRSDAAPAINLAMTPTWTGAHTFSAALAANAGITTTTLTASESRNFPYDADVATYLAAVTTAGGTISDFSARTAAELVRGLKQDGLWSSIVDLHFPLGDFTASKVKLKTGSGSASVTTTSYASGNWTEYGPARGLIAPASSSISSGITASTLSSTSCSLAFVRTNNVWGNSSNATFGTAAYNDFGFTFLPTNQLPAYQFFAVTSTATKQAYPNYYTHVKSGVWAGSGRASDIVSFFNGAKTATASGGAAAAALPSSDIRFADGTGGGYGGYVIASALTDSQHDRLSYWLTRATAAMGLNLGQAGLALEFIGDSLTYGYSASTGQITSIYPKQFQTLKKYVENGVTSYNLGVSGQTAYTVNANIARYQSICRVLPGRNVVFLWVGTNDMLATAGSPNGSASGATALSYVKAIAGGLKNNDRNVKVLVFTLFPSCTYTAGGAAYSASQYNTQVTSFNSGMLADAAFSDGSYADGIVRLDNIPEFQDTTNATYFSDGLHLTNAGAALVAARAAAAAENIGAIAGSSNAARRGTVTLVSGTATVAETSVTARSMIFPQRQTDGGTVGASYSITRTAGTSFTITAKDGSGSTQTADTSTLAYSLVEP